jgi:predicted Holliday junction resolvase-like endonuclease
MWVIFVAIFIVTLLILESWQLRKELNELKSKQAQFKVSSQEEARDYYDGKLNAIRLQYARDALEQVEELGKKYSEQLKAKLEVTRTQTRAVNFGLHAQHTIIPLLAAEQAGISNKEIRWFGDSVDFICFKGLEGDGEVEVIFADAKTSKGVKDVLDNKANWSSHKGNSPYKFLNNNQKRIVDAINNNRFKFQLWMADEDGRFEVADFKEF